MDWERMQSQWQAQAPVTRLPSMHELQRRDQSLGRWVRVRDWLETLAALVVAAFFALDALAAVTQGDRWRLVFDLLLVAWALFVPWRLRRARRARLRTDDGQPLRQALRGRRDEAIAQARMLEGVWWWYLAPPLLAFTGLTLADPSRGSRMGFLLLLWLGAACIAGLNWWTARRTFRRHADALQAQLATLDGLHREAPPTHPEPTSRPGD